MLLYGQRLSGYKKYLLRSFKLDFLLRLKSFLNSWAIINPLGEDMMKTIRLAEFL